MVRENDKITRSVPQPHVPPARSDVTKKLLVERRAEN